MGRLFHTLGFLTLLLVAHVNAAVPVGGAANAGARPPPKAVGNTHGSGQRGQGGPGGPTGPKGPQPPKPPAPPKGPTPPKGPDGTPRDGAAENTVQDNNPTTSNEMPNGNQKPKQPSSLETADAPDSRPPEAGTMNERPKGRRPQEAKPGDDGPESRTSTTAVMPQGTNAVGSAAAGRPTTVATMASPSSSPSMSTPAPVDEGSDDSNTSGVTGRRSELSLLGLLVAVGVSVIVF
ncbi:MAG: hypothetical protein Q9183_003515 [Haloplaca sp. 2 TL-2023]